MIRSGSKFRRRYGRLTQEQPIGEILLYHLFFSFTFLLTALIVIPSQVVMVAYLCVVIITYFCVYVLIGHGDPTLVKNLKELGYEDMVESARKNDSSDVIRNSTPEHAKIIVKNLLKSAKDKRENIKIISGSFFEEVYDHEIIVLLEECLEDGASVDAIVTDITAEQASKTKFGRTIFGRPNCALKSILGVYESAPHLMLVGNQRYRFEPEPALIRAIACFNDPDTASTISNIFNMIKKSVSDAQNTESNEFELA